MQNAQNVKFEILRMPPENTNSVLVSRDSNCVVFDPWGNFADWKKLFDARNIRPVAIYATHGHPDHISAAARIARQYNIPWFLGTDDFHLIGWGRQILDLFGIEQMDTSLPPTPMPNGEITILDCINMTIIKTPGHSAGGVSFWFPDYKILLTGDTLFYDGFGRYDLPGGDAGTLKQSIANLYSMNMAPDTYIVHGHGPDSTIEKLKQHNPYFVP